MGQGDCQSLALIASSVVQLPVLHSTPSTATRAMYHWYDGTMRLATGVTENIHFVLPQLQHAQAAQLQACSYPEAKTTVRNWCWRWL
jgi:hypothetical protein